MKVPAICQNKFFLMAITASFMFTSMLVFNVVFPALDSQGEQIDVLQSDIKQILNDVGYIKGQVSKIP